MGRNGMKNNNKKTLKESQCNAVKSKLGKNFLLCSLFTFQPWGLARSGLSKNKESRLSKQLLNLKANSSTPWASSATFLSINPSWLNWSNNAGLRAACSSRGQQASPFPQGHSKNSSHDFCSLLENTKISSFWLTVLAIQLKVILKFPQPPHF